MIDDISCPAPETVEEQNLSPAEIKKLRNRAKREKKIAEKKEAKKLRKSEDAPPNPTPAVDSDKDKDLFFRQIAAAMTEGLMKTLNNEPSPLDLVDRLASGQQSTTGFSATITSTTTTTAVTKIACNVDTKPNTMAKEATTTTKAVPSTTTLSPPHEETRRRSSSRTREKTSTHRKGKTPNTFTLDDFSAMEALETLVARHGRVSHMGVLDKSYTFFMSKARDAALYFKVEDKVAVVGGDPVCEPELIYNLLEEFAAYRRKFHWGIAFLGASEKFLEYAKAQRWVTMHFATEQVLNPMTNPVLLEQGGKTGKRIAVQNKWLLDAEKGGLSLRVYSPAVGKNAELQRQLVDVYEAWRDHRNNSGLPQAYITVYDPFAMPDLMTYIYTVDRDGIPNGLAALRKLGANTGFHIDPYIAAPGAPKGVTDLLIYAALALLNKAGITYLSFGFEPLDELGDITGMPSSIARMSRAIHNQVFSGLRVGRKKEYHAKFRPDKEQESSLYLLFPDGVPMMKHMKAVMHIANISLRQLAMTKIKAALTAPEKAVVKEDDKSEEIKE